MAAQFGSSWLPLPYPDIIRALDGKHVTIEATKKTVSQLQKIFLHYYWRWLTVITNVSCLVLEIIDPPATVLSSMSLL